MVELKICHVKVWGIKKQGDLWGNNILWKLAKRTISLYFKPMYKHWICPSPYAGRRSQKKKPNKIPSLEPRLSPVPLTQVRTKKGVLLPTVVRTVHPVWKHFPLASAGSSNCAIHHFLTLCWNQMTCGGWHELLKCDTERTLSAPCPYKQIFKTYKQWKRLLAMDPVLTSLFLKSAVKRDPRLSQPPACLQSLWLQRNVKVYLMLSAMTQYLPVKPFWCCNKLLGPLYKTWKG